LKTLKSGWLNIIISGDTTRHCPHLPGARIFQGNREKGYIINNKKIPPPCELMFQRGPEELLTSGVSFDVETKFKIVLNTTSTARNWNGFKIK